MTGPRRIPTAQILTHFCIDGDAVLMRRDREALIFIGVCEVCAPRYQYNFHRGLQGDE